MKVSLDHDDLSLNLRPKTGADELMLAALLRVFVEGGTVLVTPTSGKRCEFTVPKDSSIGDVEDPDILSFLACLDK